MSHYEPKKRSSACMRKQAQRARLRAADRRKIEVWISLQRLTLLRSFAKECGCPAIRIAELVMEHATPLYLREVKRRLEVVRPLLAKIKVFEHYGVTLSEHPTAPCRIGAGSDAIILYPHEHFRLRQSAEPLLVQLEHYGMSRAFVRTLVPTPSNKQAPQQPGQRSV